MRYALAPGDRCERDGDDHDESQAFKISTGQNSNVVMIWPTQNTSTWERDVRRGLVNRMCDMRAAVPRDFCPAVTVENREH